ncbi:unnamed protein product [Pleuronectes platessa]|uniref:Uncharacterized protein n=1 Tax=Pleuronectes platessa TaxID=8262 RepID=A0A9N7VQQ5_PLEPL|nr:unnamed protein product [Pleuronectes platessa]
MEEELAKHLKQLADQFHGLAPVKCLELAFEYAEKNNIPVSANWTEKECAVPLSKAPYSPKFCSMGAVHGRSVCPAPDGSKAEAGSEKVDWTSPPRRPPPHFLACRFSIGVYVTLSITTSGPPGRPRCVRGLRDPESRDVGPARSPALWGGTEELTATKQISPDFTSQTPVQDQRSPELNKASSMMSAPRPQLAS